MADYTLAEIAALRPQCEMCGSNNTRVNPVDLSDGSSNTPKYGVGTIDCLDCRGMIS